MKNRHEPTPVRLNPFAAQRGDARLLQNGLTRHIAGQQNNQRVDEAYDLKNKGAIERNLFIVRLAEVRPVRAGRQPKNGIDDIRVVLGIKFRRL